ncbi:MAG: glycosyltransferase [Chloroflexi bacterium]|nr:glycosyltransferase [Chloroflexota bacterium]
MDTPLLSVVVPCYNESENLRSGVLEQMREYLQNRPYSYEVIVSDDGSGDDSRELVRQRAGAWPEFRLQENPHRGKPWAVWSGILAARGEIVLFTDMDQSTPIDQLSRLWPYLDQGYDVVIGSRGRERANFSWYRRLGSTIFLTLRRLLLLPNIRDTQCGFKAMRRSVALELFPRLEAIRRAGPAKGWKVTAFDVELLFLAERAGYRIAEVQVEWADRDLALGKGKSYLAESKEMAMQICRVKLNAWRGFYDRSVTDQEC